jgi:hypothetical protein
MRTEDKRKFIRKLLGVWVLVLFSSLGYLFYIFINFKGALYR